MALAPAITLQVDAAQLREAEYLLRNVKGGAPKVLADGINRTLDQTKTFVSSEIRRKVKIPKRLIDPHLIVHKTGPNLSGTLQIEETHRLSLGDFNPRQRGKPSRPGGGVSYALAQGGRGFVPGAFLVTLPSRNGPYQQVFKRAKDWEHRTPQHRRGDRRSGKSGLKIISLKAVSPWGVFIKGGLMQPTIAKANELLAKNIENRLDRLLFTKTGQQLATVRAGGEA